MNEHITGITPDILKAFKIYGSGFVIAAVVFAILLWRTRKKK